ncbi:MAG: HNH endonuclease [Planctomycetaceae bacterium]|nr:HNH endonuclease [Planctomycetaceae bacterium]
MLDERAAYFRHEPDHIIAEKHGGETTAENLALACFDCNWFKGSDIASLDPISRGPGSSVQSARRPMERPLCC